jgi:hypothetical protein
MKKPTDRQLAARARLEARLRAVPREARPLEFAKDMWEVGHKWALPLALTLCFHDGGEPPEWVRTAWLGAYCALRDFRAKNWEQVLGEAGEKGAHRKNRKLHAELRYRIVCLVLKSGKATTEVFKEIAKELKADGIKTSYAMVRDIYYSPEGKGLRVLIERARDEIKRARDEGLNSDFLA